MFRYATNVLSISVHYHWHVSGAPTSDGALWQQGHLEPCQRRDGGQGLRGDCGGQQQTATAVLLIADQVTVLGVIDDLEVGTVLLLCSSYGRWCRDGGGDVLVGLGACCLAATGVLPQMFIEVLWGGVPWR